jgi:hypothetical protein
MYKNEDRAINFHPQAFGTHNQEDINDYLKERKTFSLLNLE